MSKPEAKPDSELAKPVQNDVDVVLAGIVKDRKKARRPKWKLRDW